MRFVIDDKEAFLFADFLSMYLRSIFDDRSQDRDRVHLSPKVIARRELILIARLNYISSAALTRVRGLIGHGMSFITFSRLNRRLKEVLRSRV